MKLSIDMLFQFFVTVQWMTEKVIEIYSSWEVYSFFTRCVYSKKDFFDSYKHRKMYMKKISFYSDIKHANIWASNIASSLLCLNGFSSGY